MGGKIRTMIWALTLSLSFSLLAVGTYADPGKDESGKGRGKSDVQVGPRQTQIPPGHYPPPGECRQWYPDRPAGQQPPPVPCNRLGSVQDSFILYEGRAWDASFNWKDHARKKLAKVPQIIIDLTSR